MSACRAVIFPEEEYPEVASENTLTVLTRSVNSQFSYPMQVFAFGEDGQCVKAQSLTAPSDELSLSLSPGKFKIVALSGYVADDLPSAPQGQYAVHLPPSAFSNVPLSMGLADVVMGESSQTLNLLMAHKVSHLNVSLKNVPDSITSVSVAVSPVYGAISLLGNRQEESTAVIPCTLQDGSWTTGPAYVLPSDESPTFTVTLATPGSTVSYSSLFQGSLRANTPYVVEGSYQDGVSLTGSFVQQEWESRQAVNFSFGPGAVPEASEGSGTADEEETVVDEIPQAGTVWNGHVVVEVDETQQGADLLLLSTLEWTGLTSSNYTADPDAAKRLAHAYCEGDLTGWRIPTKEEAQRLRTTYMDRLSDLNQLMTLVSGRSVLAVDDKSTTIRYLCQDASQSFAFVSGTSIAKAGAKANTYHLRLVKTVPVRLE